MKQIMTEIRLPPGPLKEELVAELMDLLLREFAWVIPRRYGRLDTDLSCGALERSLPLLIQFLNEEGAIAVKGKGGELDVVPDQRAERTGIGYLAWFTDARHAVDEAWCERHIVQCSAVARLVESPLGYTCLSEDQSRNNRPIQKAGFTEQVPRIRGYDEGLLGLYWRNFFGPPFTDLMREKLKSLPKDVARDLGEDYWFLEVEPDPVAAMSDEGRRRESELIAHLGPDLFYDMAAERLPTTRPTIKGLA